MGTSIAFEAPGAYMVERTYMTHGSLWQIELHPSGVRR